MWRAKPKKWKAKDCDDVRTHSVVRSARPADGQTAGLVGYPAEE